MPMTIKELFDYPDPCEKCEKLSQGCNPGEWWKCKARSDFLSILHDQAWFKCTWSGDEKGLRMLCAPEKGQYI